ncbi:MAG TPA: L-aspartate oxidase [Anaerolineae bacterium]|nr:L-aspartate oxidase [Anaerolineae bacterium]HOR01120.1 L-aspartate oxidase [Anaerolineae bacterium]HPL29582.1 L-aspartate oxidase [Anaerolineae bacterium]
MEDRLSVDILIIGCGIAGSVAALRASEDEGLSICVVSHAAEPAESNTRYAQGGIIHRGSADSPELLSADLVRAGDGYNNPAAVELLAGEGPPLLQELLVERLGVPFARTPDGQLEHIREAAHSTERILHVGDATGRAIEERLIEAVQARPNVLVLSQHTAVDLLTTAHHSLDRLAVYDPLSCVGAYVLDQAQGRVITILARKVILASGGLGRIFLHTTNPPGARGDGLAMAHRAGARIINAEYVQFHPTAFYHRGNAEFLISEALRGAGGRLLNAAGERFMVRYAPEWKDLAPRDEVARSIHEEMLRTGAPCVYLDVCSHVSHDEILRRFPMIHEECLARGIDITEDVIPVVPAAHYFCGGVWADLDGHTTVRNLYAVGEVSCTGLHGANRLGSASLLEGLVWGWRAAADAAATLPKTPAVRSELIPPWHEDGLVDTADPALILQDIGTIQHIMWNYVGLVRTVPRLDRALRDLHDLRRDIDRFYATTRLTDALIGLRNSAQAALLVAQAAWSNKVSRGCHYRA